MILRLFLGALISAASLACATSREPDVVPLAEGRWGWSEGELTCEKNAHTLSFSRDRSEMTLQHEKPTLMFDGSIADHAEYKVIASTPTSIRVFVVGETRRTATGELVLWDLVLVSADAYCWHRSDWPQGGCTKRIVRC